MYDLPECTTTHRMMTMGQPDEDGWTRIVCRDCAEDRVVNESDLYDWEWCCEVTARSSLAQIGVT